jgi:formate-dependent nitrite reductase cytochrome c552 subunit
MKQLKPEKIKSPLKAIREMCAQCMGHAQNHHKLIEECASPDCAIYEFRFGKNPYHTRQLSEEQKKDIAARLHDGLLANKLKGKVA